jgi:hypothetical protein
MYPSYAFIYHSIPSYDGIGDEYMSGYQGVRIPDAQPGRLGAARARPREAAASGAGPLAPGTSAAAAAHGPMVGRAPARPGPGAQAGSGSSLASESVTVRQTLRLRFPAGHVTGT